ncbi:hypothetical protein KGR20_09515 [Cytobacillus oceanisediminis]|uniref:hypothetical protein n=1 Tax=Bacillaceae TaxID=186817 RepID=UPI001CCD070D|nr:MULTISPECIES: hypothetical protein [Bacillaceae]MBZ9534493.1 hypothetical protein [Cytobacillus oceanisediminis]UTI41986.1 hypothetical protein NKG37_24740 [Niallia sp. RD1]
MSIELMQGIIEIVFKGNLLYLSPILFILMVVIFSDHLIELINRALTTNEGRRRY